MVMYILVHEKPQTDQNNTGKLTKTSYISIARGEEGATKAVTRLLYMAKRSP